MDSYTYIVLVILFYNSHCEECVLQSTQWPSEVPLEMRLHKEVLHCYDITKSPNTNNTHGVEVSLDYVIKTLEFDYREEVLTIYSWVIFEWDDDRLKWNPDKYKGIKTTNWDFTDIWTPGLSLKNYADNENLKFFESLEYMATNTGHVKSIESNVHSVICSSAAAENWPYDRKHCILMVDDEEWFQSESNIVFVNISLIGFEDTYSNSAWQLISTIERANLSGDYQASLEFVIERVAEGLEILIVVPAFVLSVLTITSILLDVKDIVRLGLLCVSLLSHYLFLTEVNENIPKYTADVPVILFFISKSMTLTLTAVILTLFLKYLCSRSSPPIFITSMNSLVLNGYGRYLVFPRWNVNFADKTVIDSINQDSEWIDFCNIMNSLFLTIAVVTYIVMYSYYIPRKHDDTTNLLMKMDFGF